MSLCIATSNKLQLTFGSRAGPPRPSILPSMADLIRKPSRRSNGCYKTNAPMPKSPPVLTTADSGPPEVRRIMCKPCALSSIAVYPIAAPTPQHHHRPLNLSATSQILVLFEVQYDA